MAPRLSRWILMTTVAAAVVAVLFLTTGGTPLLFVGYGQYSWGEEDSPLLIRQIRATEGALRTTRRLMAEDRRDAAVTAALARTDADPLALRWEGDRLVPDAVVTADLADYWQTLPTRRPEIRTVAILDEKRVSGWPPEVELRPSGRCLVTRVGELSAGAVLRSLRASAGECILAEQFGLPGAGVANWAKTLMAKPAWDLSSRVSGSRFGLTGEPNVQPAWFQAGVREWGSFYGDWRLLSVGRVELACLTGRVELCSAAAGVVEGGWPGIGPNLGYQRQRFPVASLPRDLLLELGPTKFAEVWNAPDPIEASYARATGHSMNDWVYDWARKWV
ncbi:MAG TPA: hypothetical protein VL295_04265, partial [Gemmatimonadales bacterium]|nr:hypothetical protein [Gemmatimonadales bacterium]